MPEPPLMSDAFVAYLESGLSITVGTRDAEMNPYAARAWAVRVHDDRIHLTAFVFAKTAPPILENLEKHPEIAIAIDRPTDNRACQLKGLFISSRKGRAAERAQVERQWNGFLKELELLEIPRAMTAGWTCWPAVAVKIRVTQIFEQTPGPGAGEPMP